MPPTVGFWPTVPTSWHSRRTGLTETSTIWPKDDLEPELVRGQPEKAGIQRFGQHLLHARHLGAVGVMSSLVERLDPMVTVRMSEYPMKEDKFGPSGRLSIAAMQSLLTAPCLMGANPFDHVLAGDCLDAAEEAASFLSIDADG
jgi:hypothetical protein